MSTKVHVEIPMHTTSARPRLVRANAPVRGTEKIVAEPANEIDSPPRVPVQSHASSYHRPPEQEREPDVETSSLFHGSPLRDTSTDDDQNQTPKEKKSNATSVLISRASAEVRYLLTSQIYTSLTISLRRSGQL